MNERIKEFLEQNDLCIVDGKITEFGLEEAKKFAELIIKEYEQFLPDICPWANADEEGPMRGWHVQFVARKHFGLE